MNIGSSTAISIPFLILGKRMRQADSGPEIVSSQEEHGILGLSKGFGVHKIISDELNSAIIRDRLALSNRLCARPDYPWKKSFGQRPIVLGKDAYTCLVVSNILQESSEHKRLFLQSFLYLIPAVNISGPLIHYLVERAPVIWAEARIGCEDFLVRPDELTWQFEDSDKAIQTSVDIWSKNLLEGRNITSHGSASLDSFLTILCKTLDAIPVEVRWLIPFSFGFFQGTGDQTIAIEHSLYKPSRQSSSESLSELSTKRGLISWLLSSRGNRNSGSHDLDAIFVHQAEWKSNVSRWSEEFRMRGQGVATTQPVVSLGTSKNRTGGRVGSATQEHISEIFKNWDVDGKSALLGLDHSYISAIRDSIASEGGGLRYRLFIKWALGGDSLPHNDMILGFQETTYPVWEWLVCMWAHSDDLRLSDVYRGILHWQVDAENEEAIWRKVPELCFSAMLVRDRFQVVVDPLHGRQCPRVLNGLFEAACAISNVQLVRRRFFSNCLNIKQSAQFISNEWSFPNAFKRFRHYYRI